MRKLDGFWRNLVIVMSIALIIFQLYTAIFGVFFDLLQRSIHLFFVLTLLFLKFPMFKKQKNQTTVPWYDCLLAIIGIACCLFVIKYNEQMAVNGLSWFGPFDGKLDMFLAACMVILVLEASRRTVGLIFPILALIFLFYALQGEIFPGIWGHKNMALSSILQQLYHTTSGLWGSMVGLSAGMLAMFSIFGEILGKTGGVNTFINLGKKLTGNTIGGSGKVTLLASGLFGMISGSSVAIVLATGTFTIPMMKKDGFSREWAGAISSVGATGGQIMPPIMGSGAFIMAQLLSISYMTVAKSAIVPALLYYFAAFIAIHYAAKKFGVLGKKEKTSFNIWEILIIALPVIVFFILLVMGYSVTRGALIASGMSLVVCIASYLALDKGNALKKTARLCYDTTLSSGNTIISIAGMLVGSELIVSMMAFTGISVKMSSLIMAFGQNNLLICLILAMVVALILGIGLPTTAAYVLGTAVLVPPLTKLGLDPLVAHLFIFFFACLSGITPPVCSSVFVAAGIAGGDWWKTGWLSCALALPVFIVPYTLAYNGALMLNGDFVNMIIGVISALIGAYFIGIAVAGFYRTPIPAVLRVLLAVGGIMLAVPYITASLIGLTACIAILFVSTKVMKNAVYVPQVQSAFPQEGESINFNLDDVENNGLE